MPSFRLTALAKKDLKKIAVFTEHQWGTEQRNHYLLQFDQCFHQLSENPSLGNACDYIKTGYRKHPQESHLIFYRMGSNDIIEIIGVLHKGMDISSKFYRA